MTQQIHIPTLQELEKEKYLEGSEILENGEN